jgi:dihydroorotate dehydrogenase
MKDTLIYVRNWICRLLYKLIFRNIFFLQDPEVIHDRVVHLGNFLGSNPFTQTLTSMSFSYSDKKLEQVVNGVRFTNPVGLAAGFDKDALLTGILPAVGFGHAEVGSITGEPCIGNPRPRLWRLKKSKGLAVHYGLKNDGAEQISKRLAKKTFRIPIGTSIAKTNSKETIGIEAGINDYAKAFEEFTSIGSYFTINISCPNTFGGEPFTDSKKLERLLAKIDKIPTKKPIFLKLSPDLTKKEIDNILFVSARHKIDGFVCGNLTKKRKINEIVDRNVPARGSLSGKIVEDLSNEQIRYVYQKTKGKYAIVGCGGVFSAKDAYKKIKLGASLVQLITGMIYEGPQLISEINQGLARLLKKDGFTNVSQAVGVENK